MPPYLAKSFRETELRWSPPKRTPCAILVRVFASQDIRCPDWCARRCRQPTCILPHSGLGTPRSIDGNIARRAREADISCCGQSVRLFPVGQTNSARPWIGIHRLGILYAIAASMHEIPSFLSILATLRSLDATLHLR